MMMSIERDGAWMLALAALVIIVLPGQADARKRADPPEAANERPAKSRWGTLVDGRWHAGATAPGGWAGYRAPVKGEAIPQYWFAQAYYVGDWEVYGLWAPPYGLAWSRYYDDAVLIDGRGTVYEFVQNVDWTRSEPGMAPVAARSTLDGSTLFLASGNGASDGKSHLANPAGSFVPGVTFAASDAAQKPGK